MGLKTNSLSVAGMGMAGRALVREWPDPLNFCLAWASQPRPPSANLGNGNTGTPARHVTRRPESGHNTVALSSYPLGTSNGRSSYINQVPSASRRIKLRVL